ncbi:O-antigen ligase family protein [Pseudomonas sp. C11]|uniref:O-antigen ligase family protein n=1 Tax=Pseudomonas sp. C11 TaxID=3075550 RepID=UPI002AFEE9C2|nr:O-antigen ligase family protein [Pseudomonas sp. C11]
MNQSFDAVAGHWVRSLLIFFFIATLGVINTASSLVNNLHVAMLEVFFCLSVCILWRTGLSVLGGYRHVAYLFSGVVLSVLLANTLAAHNGVAFADWRRVFELFAHMALFVAMFLLFILSADALSSILWGVGFSVFLVLLFVVQVWISAENPYTYPWVSSPPLFTHVRNLGGFFCAASVILGFAFFYFVDSRRFVFLGLYMLALSVLLWSGGRGAMVAFVCGFLLILLRYPYRMYRRSWVALALVTCSALVLAAYFDVGNRSMGWLNMFSRTLGAQSIDQVSSSRIYIWGSLLGFIMERPWFGWGGEAFRALGGNVSLVQPHNSFLQLLSEWGVIATSLIMGGCAWLFSVCSLRYVQLRTKSEPLLVLGLGLGGALFLLSLVDGVFYHGTSAAFFVIGCAAMGAGIHRTSAFD